MEDLRKGMNKIFNVSIVTSVIILVLGIFLFIQPDTIIYMVSIILGGIILIPGIITLINYIKTKQQSSLIMAIISILIGLILMLNTELVASILPFILGIYFVINGINRTQYAMSLKKTESINNTISLVFSILIIICGIVFIINPFKGALVITKIIGIFMIIYAILDLTNTIIIKKEINIVSNKKSMKDTVIEIEVDNK